MNSKPLPRFAFDKLLYGHEPLTYDPTGEWIFPAPFLAGEHLPNALAKWYIYYSPHNNPGGICLATAERIDGQWTEHADNPLIATDWPPHYSTGHVASPHALWLPDEKRMLLFYHGDNRATRIASSEDGIHFTYEGIAIHTGLFPNLTEASYARVFPWELPDTDSRYVMLFMGHDPVCRHIYLAHSPDARCWTPRAEPVCSPPVEDGQNCAPWLWQWGEQTFVVHHCDIVNGPGDIYATPVDADMRQTGPSQLLYKATTEPPDNTRAGDPVLIEEDGELLLVYCAGRRLDGGFALARTVGEA